MTRCSRAGASSHVAARLKARLALAAHPVPQSPKVPGDGDADGIGLGGFRGPNLFDAGRPANSEGPGVAACRRRKNLTQGTLHTHCTRRRQTPIRPRPARLRPEALSTGFSERTTPQSRKQKIRESIRSRCKRYGRPPRFQLLSSRVLSSTCKNKNFGAHSMTVTVVVIEDEPATLELIVGYLVRSGHQVQGCTNLADANRAIANMRPDVIVSASPCLTATAPPSAWRTPGASRSPSGC